MLPLQPSVSIQKISLDAVYLNLPHQPAAFAPIAVWLFSVTMFIRPYLKLPLIDLPERLMRNTVCWHGSHFWRKPVSRVGKTRRLWRKALPDWPRQLRRASGSRVITRSWSPNSTKTLRPRWRYRRRCASLMSDARPLRQRQSKILLVATAMWKQRQGGECAPSFTKRN